MIHINDQTFDLTGKEEAFCREFVKSNNQSWAYYKAFWETHKTKDWADQKTRTQASKKAYELLNRNESKTKEINNYIKYLRELIIDETIADAVEIQQFLTKVMRGDPSALFFENKDDTGKVLKRTPRQDLEKFDGLKAADLLNKMQGNYLEKMDDEVIINVRIGENEE